MNGPTLQPTSAVGPRNGPRPEPSNAECVRPAPGQRYRALVTAMLLGLPGLFGQPAGAETRPPADALSHWAFQPPKATAPPAVRNERWVKTPIDRFILARIESAGLTPAPEADPRTLLRRMSFDLTGLPPTEAEVNEFTADARRDRDVAVARWADRLLDRPAYGERWGRHWLDVARYSDTKGYVYGREERRFVHAPAYRDWVIGAFNAGLPYDRFLLLQLAGDQLLSQGSPDLPAMGFLTGGRRFLGVTHDIIDDRIDVVTRGTMALTVQCARCHDHKYDPIPTADYYSLYGVFHGSDERLLPLAKGMGEDAELDRRRKKLADTMAQRRAEAGSRLRARIGDYLAAQLELEKYPEEGFDQILSPNDLIPASVRRWRDYLRTHANPGHPLFAPWFALSGLKGSNETVMTEARTALVRVLARPDLNPLVAAAFADPPSSAHGAARRYKTILETALRDTNAPGAAAWQAFLNDPHSPATVPDSGIVNNEQYFPTSVTEELWKLQGEVDRRLIELGVPAALVLTDREPQPNPRVFKRGSPSRPGEEVPRQFLAAASRGARQPFRHGSGRLELAQAIATPENPLTARVMVNRLWLHHFGAGLVRTPSDFGLRAAPPSHPELLDWLARQLMAEGWHLKRIHRLIVTSAVYRQRSLPHDAPSGPGTGHAARVRELDPDNRWLSHFPIRRLDFESVRDAMLAVSGELDRRMGGQPAELLDPANRRRTVYAFVDRQFLPGTFRTFDFANPDIHVAVRHETTVPQQALFFLNGRFAADRARALARQLPFDGNPAQLDDRLQTLYGRLFQREPARQERSEARQFLAAAQADAPPVSAPVRETPWRYGTGEVDEATGRLKGFTALPHFTGTSWQGAEAFPGGATGWAQLTAEGGHPGNTRAHACVRRWVAPADGIVQISGTLRHEPEPGDGVRGFLLSSRHGQLKAASVHQGTADMTARDVAVRAGDTLEFVVDIGNTLSYDQFLWSPEVTFTATGNSTRQAWNARTDFAGPPPAPALLTPWEQYIHVLLLSNEFAFCD